MSSTGSARAQNPGASNLEQNQQIENQEPSGQESITQLAYALWERRGRPEGSSEEDWREAEKQVRLPQATAVSR